MKKTVQKIISALLVAILTFGAAPAVWLVSVSAADSGYKTGDIIQYGTYPQRDVTSTMGGILDSIQAGWISYEYPLVYNPKEDQETVDTPPYMLYKDVTFNGEKYRGVTFEEYRPHTIGAQNEGNSNLQQGNSGYVTGQVYWFKFEPLKWRVLDPEEGFVMCNNIIDSQPYHDYVTTWSIADNEEINHCWGDPEKTHYANNYAYSSIRQWLNDDFYNTAFSDEQKANIKITSLNNDCWGTLNGSEGYEEYDAPSTDDKVFLLSNDEAVTYANIFSVNSDYDLNKKLTGSDYAKCQGLDTTVTQYDSGSRAHTYWWLRTPGHWSILGVMVDTIGYPNYGVSVFYTGGGVCPALKLQELKSDSAGGEIIDPPHRHVYMAVSTPATCTERGYTTYTCSCGEQYVGSYVKALGHDFGKWIMTTPGSCTAKGVLTRYCSRCDATETIELDNFEHSYTTESVPPTCTEKGHITYTCTLCGHSYVEDYSVPLGHNFGKWEVTTPATCTSEGLETRHCSRCEAEETRKVEKTDHTYEPVVTPPTCTEDGYTTYTCTCGDSYIDDYVPLLGHDFGDWRLTTPATCTEKGVLTRYCSRCDATETTEIEKLEHIFKVTLIQPTCTEKGYTIYNCSLCGESHVDNYVDAKGHTEGEWVVTKEPTYTEAGIKTLYCSDCGEVIETESIPRLEATVQGVSIDDLSLDYKDTGKMNPKITADPGTKYTVTYLSSDPSIVIVDAKGNVYGAKPGAATVTLSVTDEQGNTVVNTCKVTVRLAFWQWMIRILLFGWIWY